MTTVLPKPTLVGREVMFSMRTPLGSLGIPCAAVERLSHTPGTQTVGSNTQQAGPCRRFFSCGRTHRGSVRLGVSSPSAELADKVPTQHTPMKHTCCDNKKVVSNDMLDEYLRKNRSKIDDSMRKGVEGSVAALFTLLRIYGLKGSARTDASFHKTVKVWLVGAVAAGSWMKYVKWKLASFFFTFTRQMDVPPPPPWGGDLHFDDASVLACGVAGRFSRLAATGVFRHSFLASILQVKKGCPRPSVTDLNTAALKTVEALCTDHKEPVSGFLLPWGDIPDGGSVEFYLSRLSVMSQLSRTVHELFDGAVYGDAERYRIIFPSTSSANDSSRSKGGAFASLRKMIGLWKMDVLSDTSSQIPSQRSAIRTVPSCVREEHITSTPDVRCDVDLLKLEARHRSLQNACTTYAAAAPSPVKLIMLAESLKSRGITVGSSPLQKSLHPLQKVMWKVLRRCGVFRLIGEPVTARVVQDSLGKRLNDDEYYLSGDYSAATDNLAPWVSSTIANAISDCLKLTVDERSNFLKSLIGNEFVLPDGSRRRQRWGQLMGSIVSFPVLCIANAALCRWSCEVEKQRLIPLANLRMLINGDDVVFPTTLRGHKLWERITAFAGLETSLGKTFLSKEFAQINSVNFIHSSLPVQVDGVRPIHFTETQYVNLGLLFGLKRSGEKVGLDSVADSELTLGTRCRALIGSCPVNLREQVMSQFLKHHAKVLANCGVPWFVPEHLGGVGLPTVVRDVDYIGSDEPQAERFYRWGPSRLDCQIVRRILEPNFRKVISVDGDYVVRTKPRFPVGRASVEAPWKVYRQVLQKLPVPLVYGHPTEQEERSWQIVFTAYCYDAFLSDASLMTEVGERHLKVLNQNRTSWKLAARSPRLPSPMLVKSLSAQKQDTPYLRVDRFSTCYPLPLKDPHVFDEHHELGPWSRRNSFDPF